MRIAMWSGPRNLSTAMMYSFAARGDCAVWDEPFYAPYLAATGLDHPMRDEILRAHDTNPERVADACCGAVPDGKTHFYMKHMPHHMVEGMPMAWADACVNIHLIRHPARVIASYARKRADITLDDIGFAIQVDIFDQLGGIVIDGTDIRRDPAHMLGKLCAEIGLSYSDAMLSWPKGGHAQDGAWAPHWYGAVHRSSGFAGAEGPLPDVPVKYQDVLDQAMGPYRYLSDSAITI